MNLKSDVIIFTDGSSRGNPGPGGYAAVIILRQNDNGGNPKSEIRNPKHEKVIELGGGKKHTTNNRMELAAAIEGLRGSTSNRERGRTSKTVVYTDSSYLINGITKWVYGWQKNGWKTADKKEVENRDLWEQLLNSTTYRTIEWKLIKGHSGVSGNMRCDEIATEFADGKNPKLYSGVLKNYRIKDILEVSRGQTSNRERGLTSKKQRSKAPAYSYVSVINGVIQTHQTWAECEKRVKGARGAKYQKVFSADEEAALIKNWQ